MGLFSEAQKAFNSGRDRARAEAEARRKRRAEARENRKVVKLIGPNDGRTVTLQVLAEEPVLSMMIDMLTTIKGYQNTSVTISGNVVTFVFEDDALAESFRNAWVD